MNQREQPGGEVAPDRIEATRISPYRQEHLLYHLLGKPVVSTDPPGQRVARPAETLVEPGQRFPIRIPVPPRKLLA